MPSRSDHRSRWVASGTARVQPVDGCGVGHSLVKAERIIDMMDMAVADAEMLFDFLGCQGENIHHAIAESRSKLVCNAHEMVDVAILFLSPTFVMQFVRYPLHEKC